MANERELRVPRVLSWFVVVLMAMVSAGGVFFSEVYRDNPLIASTFHWQDYVTLFVAVPLLIIGLVLDGRGSLRGTLIWIAMLGYAVYGYAFYCFGAAFNVFFLPYVALFATSLFAVVLLVPRLDVEGMADRFEGAAARWVAVVYMLVTAAGLGVLWTAFSASFLFTGSVPGPIVASGHPTGVVFVLDLAIVVPLMAIGAVLLIRRRAWGWFLAAVMSWWGWVYTLSLAVASVGTRLDAVGTGSELPIWGILTVLGVASAALVLAAVKGPR